MPILRAFRGVRPAKSKVEQVAARAFDAVYSQESRTIIAENEYSFLHVMEPALLEGEMPGADDELLYDRAKDNFNRFVDEGILVSDREPCLYIYQAKENGFVQTGIWGVSSLDDYLNNKLKKHELTRAEREKGIKDYLDNTGIDANPVLVTYPPVKAIDNIVAKIIADKPEYFFKSEDKVEHRVWVVKDKKLIEQLQNSFAKMPSSYIADGHHRAAASSMLGVEKRKQNLKHNGNEEYNFFSSVYFPANQLHIYEFNRLIKDINGFTAKEFIDKIADSFMVSELNVKEYKPAQLHTFGMYLEGKWYSLTAKPFTYSLDNPVSQLDVSIIHDYLLNPILGISDPRTDQRIDFVGGIKGIEALISPVNNGEMKVAFTLFPTSIDQLFQVADSGNVMPPKSTWFEPKIHCGLIVHKLDN